MKELEEKILSMLVSGKYDTKEYNVTMREYVKALVQEEFEIDYYEDSVYTDLLWGTIVNTVNDKKFIDNVIKEDYQENKDDYTKVIKQIASDVGVRLRLEV